MKVSRSIIIDFMCFFVIKWRGINISTIFYSAKIIKFNHLKLVTYVIHMDDNVWYVSLRNEIYFVSFCMYSRTSIIHAPRDRTEH